MASKFTSITAILTCLLLGLVGFTNAYKITIKNSCRYTIWPGLAEHDFVGVRNFPHLTRENRGHRLDSGQQWTATVPDKWVGGRIWARTGCNADCSRCTVGTCPGGLYCTDYNWTDKLSVAEFGSGPAFRNVGQTRIYYNLSVMQGFNVPVRVQEHPSGRQKFCGSLYPPRGQAWIPSDGESSTSVNNCDVRGASFTVTFC